MKILQINGYESPGRRFNGLSLTRLLKIRGIDSSHLVWIKDSSDPAVFSLAQGGARLSRYISWVKSYNNSAPWFDQVFKIGKRNISIRGILGLFDRLTFQRGVNWIAGKLERTLSLQSILYVNSWWLTRMSIFKEADVLHLHIIHSGYLSLWSLPAITLRKPTVWTLHDPWAFTGHCVSPYDCTRWQKGCGQCPKLETPMPLREDRTAFLFRYKQRMLGKSKFDVIVASRWMLNMVQTSPMLSRVRIHHVPFGLDLSFFSQAAAPNSRLRFGIPAEALVICFRSDTSEFKGLNHIIQALEEIHCEQPVYLVTFATKGLMLRFADRFQLVELGWTHDEELTRDAFVASDIFLMPSMAEAFGLMAIEAMACGKPVISFEGTALPEVTFAPDVGIAVPMGDTKALANALQHLIDFPEERKERGRKSRIIAEKHYDAEMQADRLAAIYRAVAAR